MSNRDWIKQYKFQVQPGYVVHMSPTGKKKFTIPTNIKNKRAAHDWLMKHWKKPIQIKKAAVPVKVKIMIGGHPTKFNCNTSLFKKVRNANGATGFQATEMANRAGFYTVPVGKMTVAPGMAKIGKGTQGVVFLAYTSKSATDPITVKVSPFDKTVSKQASHVEYEIQEKLYKIVPANIPRPIAYIKECKNFIPESTWTASPSKSNMFDYSRQSVEFSEYINGGSLSDWLKKFITRVDESFMRNMISQVLNTLGEIQSKYPGFRHNDMHIDNILVKQHSWAKYPTFVLNDFGWAKLTSGNNPLVNSNNHTGKYGIGTQTSGRYDMHLFLNEIHKWMLTHKVFPKAKAFIEKHLTTGYLGSNNKYISESRLRYGISYPGLSSLKQVLEDPYVISPKNYINNLRTFTNAQRIKFNLMKKNVSTLKKMYAAGTPRTRINIQKILKTNSPKTPLSKIRSHFTRVHKGRKPMRPNAQSITPRRLSFKSPSKNMENNWAKVTPRTFMKLTPSRRAKVASARKALASQKNKFVKFSPKKVKTPSPKAKSKTPVSIPRSVLKSSKFNKFVQKFLIQPTTPVMLSPEKKLKWEKQYGNYYTRLNAARGKALSALRNRKRMGMPLFSPSPLRPKSKTPSPVKPMKTPVRSNLPKQVRRFAYKVQFNKDNRMKIKKQSDGRVVYVNGPSVSLEYLKFIAAHYGVNIKGLRSKTDIANKIFRNNK